MFFVLLLISNSTKSKGFFIQPAHFALKSTRRVLVLENTIRNSCLLNQVSILLLCIKSRMRSIADFGHGRSQSWLLAHQAKICKRCKRFCAIGLSHTRLLHIKIISAATSTWWMSCGWANYGVAAEKMHHYCYQSFKHLERVNRFSIWGSVACLLVSFIAHSWSAAWLRCDAIPCNHANLEAKLGTFTSTFYLLICLLGNICIWSE